MMFTPCIQEWENESVNTKHIHYITKINLSVQITHVLKEN